MSTIISAKGTSCKTAWWPSRHCKSLEETHRERRPNSEFYLRPVPELEALFQEYPEALANTLKIAERCTLDLTRDLSYTFPDYPAPDGLTPDSYLEKLAMRPPSGVTAPSPPKLKRGWKKNSV